MVEGTTVTAGDRACVRSPHSVVSGGRELGSTLGGRAGIRHRHTRTSAITASATGRARRWCTAPMRERSTTAFWPLRFFLSIAIFANRSGTPRPSGSLVGRS